MNKRCGSWLALIGAVVCFGAAPKVAFCQENKEVSAINRTYMDADCVQCFHVEDLNLNAKSAYLMDYETSTPVYVKNEKTRLPIASMCKIMTLILSFDAIHKGFFALEDEINVSERAASMGGSQVFLEANAKYSAKELIKSIVVCSANDSCVAMAEKIAGSEELFVAKMNEKAKELGANDTLFANCTGLPRDPQYSCAYDVAIMLKELLKNQEYYEFGKVWMDKFQHPEGRYTEISNTNKLVRYYDGCDGGKTGFTNEAGFCLAATAKRDNMRVISVVIGEKDSKTRFNDVRTMFDYAFANYCVTPLVQSESCIDMKADVCGGKEKSVNVHPARAIYVFTKKGEVPNVSMETTFFKAKAPISQDAQIGELVVYKDGIEYDRVELLSNNAIEKASLWDRIREIGQKWNAR